MSRDTRELCPELRHPRRVPAHRKIPNLCSDRMRVMQPSLAAYGAYRGDGADEETTLAAGQARRHTTAKAIREAGFYEPSDLSRLWASSQMCPPGSVKLAVRMPHGRSTGPLSSPTP